MLEAVNMRTGLWRDHRTRFRSSDGQSERNSIWTYSQTVHFPQLFWQTRFSCVTKVQEH